MNKAQQKGSRGSVPRVTRITPEGEVRYDPASAIRSEPAQEHINDLQKRIPSKLVGRFHETA